MNLPQTIKTELHSLCQKIAKLIGLKQGSVEIHCFHGEPKEIHIHDKSIKFEVDKESKNN